MKSYNQRKAELLFSINVDTARSLLGDAEKALRRGRKKEAARLCMKALENVQSAVALKKQLRAMQKEQDRIRREAKYNLYAGGNLYTGW